MLREHQSAVRIRRSDLRMANDGHKFVERAVLEEHLDALLKPRDKFPVRILVSGLPGAGKTVYLDHVLAKHARQFSFVIKCRGDSFENFERDLVEAFRGMPGFPKRAAERPAWIQKYLSENVFWLIFIDNLTDSGWLEQYFSTPTGTVVATANRALPGFADPLPMPPMTDSEVEQFLNEQPARDKASDDRLIAKLARLPLA